MDSSSAGLSPQDRDLAIRTVLGEAGNQGDDGMLGVANVILNRAASGKYGRSVSDVVTANNGRTWQFEPWGSRSSQLMAYSPDSPAYQRAGQILDAASSGQAPDNTDGSTHFYAPKTQAALGRSAPSWGQGQPTTQIGSHVFFAPEGKVQRQQQQDAGPDVDGLLSAWGVAGSGGKPANQSAVAGNAPSADGPDR